MCDTLPVHILGYCFGKGVCVDTLVMIQSVWQIIWMLPGKGGIMWATT